MESLLDRQAKGAAGRGLLADCPAFESSEVPDPNAAQGDQERDGSRFVHDTGVIDREVLAAKWRERAGAQLPADRSRVARERELERIREPEARGVAIVVVAARAREQRAGVQHGTEVEAQRSAGLERVASSGRTAPECDPH